MALRELPDPEPLAELPELPATTREIPLKPETLQKLVSLQMAVQVAEQARDAFHDGLAAGLGVNVVDITGVDIERGALVLRGDA